MKRLAANWRGFSMAMLVLITVLSAVGTGYAQLKTGQPAPLFVLKDVGGKAYELSSMRNQPMIIVYFFDIGSKSSQEGLLYLVDLSEKYKDSDLVVWGVTRSNKTAVSKFLKSKNLAFPVLIDKGPVSDAYSARLVLPTICIIGPDLKLLDYFQGGGKTTESMLLSLAERELQRRNTVVARAISEKVASSNPKSVRAASVKGYAQLKEGDLKSAEKTFYNLSRDKGEAEILGKEGLSQVYAQKGEPTKAAKLASEVENKAGSRARAYVLKGDLLYSQNKPAEAEKEYRKAISKARGDSTEKAVAYNQLGRIYALKGKYEQSRQMYDQAVVLDPYYVEATSNKGLTYERQGEWDKALEFYRKARTINRNDPFAAVLAAHAQKRMLIQKDPDRRKQFDEEVRSIVERYKQNAPASGDSQSRDAWTSGPLSLFFVEPYETGGLAKRDGFARILTLQLADSLNKSGRITIVDPIVVEKVITKLGLSDKDLADSSVQNRLARACGASLVGKGSLFHLTEGTLLSLKMENLSESDTVDKIERQFASSVTLKKDLHWLNREILTAIMKRYPLQAFVVEVTGNQILLNLGAKQGVVPGALFNVVEVKPAVNYKGKVFKPEPSVMATIEVVRVDDDFAYAHIKDQRRPITADDKLREALPQVMEGDQKVW